MKPGHRQFQVSWRTPHDEGRWSALFARAGSQGLQLAQDATRAGILIFGPALVDSHGGMVLELTVRKRTEASEWSWDLEMWSRPQGEPPQAIIDATKKLGGTEGASALIAEFASTPTAAARHSVHFHLPVLAADCPLLPRGLQPEDSALEAAALKATINKIGYRFEGGTDGLSELTIEHDDDEYIVDALGVAQLKIDATFAFPFFDQLVEIVSRTAFRAKHNE